MDQRVYLRVFEDSTVYRMQDHTVATTLLC